MAPTLVTGRNETEVAHFAGLTGTAATIGITAVLVVAFLVLGLLSIGGVVVYSRAKKAGGLTKAYPWLAVIGFSTGNRVSTDEEAQNDDAGDSRHEGDNQKGHALQVLNQPAANDRHDQSQAPLPALPTYFPRRLSARGNLDVYSAAFPNSRLTRSHAVANLVGGNPGRFTPSTPSPTDSSHTSTMADGPGRSARVVQPVRAQYAGIRVRPLPVAEDPSEGRHYLGDRRRGSLRRLPAYRNLPEGTGRVDPTHWFPPV